MQGAWCEASNNGASGQLPNGFAKLTTRYNKADADANCDALTLDRNSFDIEGSGGNLVKVVRMGDEDGRPVYQLDFKAGYSGARWSETWNESWRAYVTADGQLQIRTKETNHHTTKF
jgi:hypothetical protein